MASFVLRRIDDALWGRFRALAAAEGVTTKDLLLRLIAAYVQGTAVALALLLGSSVAAHAEDRPSAWKPLTALAAGQALDVWSTRVAVGRGCVEGNSGFYGSSTPTTGRLIAGKALTIGPAAVAAAFLHKSGHHKIAAALGYGGGAVGASIGALNLSRSCGGAR